MRVAVIGANGTLGSAVVAALTPHHEVVRVAHSKGEYRVDLTDPFSIGLGVASGTVLFGLFGFATDSTMTSFIIPDDIHAGLVGAIVGLGAGLAFWLLLAGLRERRILLADQIHRLSELNHTVRNSLNLIALVHTRCGRGGGGRVRSNEDCQSFPTVDPKSGGTGAHAGLAETAGHRCWSRSKPS